MKIASHSLRKPIDKPIQSASIKTSNKKTDINAFLAGYARALATYRAATGKAYKGTADDTPKSKEEEAKADAAFGVATKYFTESQAMGTNAIFKNIQHSKAQNDEEMVKKKAHLDEQYMHHREVREKANLGRQVEVKKSKKNKKNASDPSTVQSREKDHSSNSSIKKHMDKKNKTPLQKETKVPPLTNEVQTHPSSQQSDNNKKKALDLTYLDYQVKKIQWGSDQKTLMEKAGDNETFILDAFTAYLEKLSALTHGKTGISHFAKNKLKQYQKTIPTDNENLSVWAKKLDKYKKLDEHISEKLKPHNENEVFSEETKNAINEIQKAAEKNVEAIATAKEAAERAVALSTTAKNPLDELASRTVSYVNRFPDPDPSSEIPLRRNLKENIHKSTSGQRFTSTKKDNNHYVISVASDNAGSHHRQGSWINLADHEKTVVDAAIQALENHPENTPLYIYTDNVQEAELVYLTARIYGIDVNCKSPDFI